MLNKSILRQLRARESEWEADQYKQHAILARSWWRETQPVSCASHGERNHVTKSCDHAVYQIHLTLECCCGYVNSNCVLLSFKYIRWLHFFCLVITFFALSTTTMYVVFYPEISIWFCSILIRIQGIICMNSEDVLKGSLKAAAPPWQVQAARRWRPR